MILNRGGHLNNNVGKPHLRTNRFSVFPTRKVQLSIEVEVLALAQKANMKNCPIQVCLFKFPDLFWPNMTGILRGEICQCRHCRWQCKIFASGVNFSRNDAIYNINESTKYILP